MKSTMAAPRIQVKAGLWVLGSSWFSVLTVLTWFVVAATGLQDSEKQNSPKSDKVQGFNDELRILLIGKTGVGKSTTGNTILRKKAFVSEFSSASVTKQCEKEDGDVNGRKVSVIDSPGLFDTYLSPDEVMNRIKMCIPLSSPGPHVFVVVVQLGRFTEEEEKTIQLFETIFGEESSRYTMILFTHGDQLEGKSIHPFVRESPKLMKFIRKYGGRYHVFNNNEDQDEQQVIQLLDQIDKLVSGNGGEHYTSEMLEETERLIEEEKRRILKESEAQRKEEIKKLRAHLNKEMAEMAIQVYIKDQERKARWKAEREPSLFEKIIKFLKAAFNKIYRFFESMYHMFFAPTTPIPPFIFNLRKKDVCDPEGGVICL